MLFTLGVLVIAALLFGLAPLRVALAGKAELALKTSAATSNTNAGKSRMGRVVVALQMTMCVVLLVGAGLLLRTLQNLQNTPLGMDVDGLVVFGVNPNIPSLPAGRAFYVNLTNKLRALPGVESVTVMEERIGSWWSDNSAMMVDGKLPDFANGGSRTVRSNVVGPNFFRTLGVPVLSGREFADSDTAMSTHVGIINEEFAKRFFPGLNPLGHTIGSEDGQYTMMVVGVVKDHKYRSIDEEPIPMAWYYLLNRWPHPEMTRTEVVREFETQANRLGRKLSPVTLEQHFDVFLHSYVPTRSAKGEILEDNLDCPLVELELIRSVGERAPGGKVRRETIYSFRRQPKPDISSALFAYCLEDFWQKRRDGELTLSFRDVSVGEGSPGQVFKLPDSDIRQRLESISLNDDIFAYQESAALQRVIHKQKNRPELGQMLALVYSSEVVHA
jgi:hypothetical protein